MNLVTRNAYAKLCGVSRQAIHDRITRGTLTPVTYELPDGSTQLYIDIEQFPPQKLKPGRK